MQNEDRPSSDSPEVQVATVETDSPDLIAVPVVPHPSTLVQVFRLLQQRIPGFTHLSVQQQRSMARAAHLDPEFLEEGITGICAAGEDAKALTRDMNGDECRELADEIRHNDEVYREIMVLAKGIAAANLERKHRLGRSVLNFYGNLGLWANDRRGKFRHLMAYYERMKHAYMKGRKTRGKAKAKDAETTKE